MIIRTLLPILWEVGQRFSFSNDYRYPETASLLWRDEKLPTQARQQQQLVARAHGSSDLPSWSVGSSNQDNVVPSSPLYAIVDLLRGDTISLPIRSILSAIGPSGLDSLSGISSRKAFIVQVANAAYYTGQQIAYSPNDSSTVSIFGGASGSILLREAASFWDFCTAFDPCWLPLRSNNGLLIRNLDPVTKVSFTIPPSTGLIPILYSSLLSTASGLLPDEPVTFIWSGDQSLSDDEYIPSAEAQKGQADSFDLSTGTLSAGTGASASFLNPGSSLAFLVKPISGVLSAGSDLTPLG